MTFNDCSEAAVELDKVRICNISYIQFDGCTRKYEEICVEQLLELLGSIDH
jgi:hypothetical protein